MRPQDNPIDPHVLSVASEPGQVAIELRVPAQLRYFHGHFHQHPILPGVVQLAWAAAFGKQHLQAGAELLRLEGLKFSRVIRPEARLSLLLEWSAPQRCLSFRYLQSGLPCSAGRFIFAT